MIVRQFINWVRTASEGERTDATRALCQAWLYSPLSPNDRVAAEGALAMLLDDVSPRVRRAMAETFARSADAPLAIIRALAQDLPGVAAPVLEGSPLLLDADLVDLVATGTSVVQVAIARRIDLPSSVCGAIAEVGSAESAIELMANPSARLVPLAWERIVARHGAVPEVREAMLALDGLPASIRLTLATKLSESIEGDERFRSLLGDRRAKRVTRDAMDRTVVQVAAETGRDDLRALVGHLRAAGQLTAGLILRTQLSGNSALVAHALSELSGLSHRKVEAILRNGYGAALDALLYRAGLPQSVAPAFHAALASRTDVAPAAGDASRLRRATCERVLAACEQNPEAEDHLIVMLRKFTTEAARDDARLLCDELTSEQPFLLTVDRIAA